METITEWLAREYPNGVHLPKDTEGRDEAILDVQMRYEQEVLTPHGEGISYGELYEIQEWVIEHAR